MSRSNRHDSQPLARSLRAPASEIAGHAPRLGAHVSVAGGMPRAFEHAAALGCTAMQVFVKNQRRWQGRGLLESETASFRAARAASQVVHTMAHASYLINLASPIDALYERSIAAMEEEMRLCAALGVASLVVHPGAHLGSGEVAGLRRISAALQHLVALPGLETVAILLESTAGQGSCVGHRLEHLSRALLDAGAASKRLGICIDTCHLLAASYDFRSPRGYEQVMREVETVLGLQSLRAFHLNDSKAAPGARVDRHATIGAGWIGARAFGRLVRDARFAGLPMILEVPGGMPSYRRDLLILRRMLRDAPVRP